MKVIESKFLTKFLLFFILSEKNTKKSGFQKKSDQNYSKKIFKMEQGEQISVMMETNELDPNSFHNEMFHNIKEIFEKKLFCDVTLFGKDTNSNDTQVLKG
jgi:hypothetical protein